MMVRQNVPKRVGLRYKLPVLLKVCQKLVIIHCSLLSTLLLSSLSLYLSRCPFQFTFLCSHSAITLTRLFVVITSDLDWLTSQQVLEKNQTAGRDWKLSISVIYSTHGTSFLYHNTKSCGTALDDQ